MTDLLLAFDDERHLAEPLAAALGVPLRWIERHAFPDGESRLRLPAQLPRQVALLRGLQRPNEKLAELMMKNRDELALIEPLRTLRLIHYSAWLARRWDDPTFPVNFPWFGSSDYWQGQVQMLEEQLEAMQEDPLVV